MSMPWILRLCVTLLILVACSLFVMTASSTSAGLAGGQPAPRAASDARRFQDWSWLGPVNQGDNGDNDEGENAEEDNDEGDNGDEGDNDNDADDDDDDDDDGGDDNESFTIDLPPLPEPPPRITTPTCTTPGTETIFRSRDGKVTLRVFPTMPVRLRISILPSYDLLSLPPPPGRLAALLIYDVAAAPCDGGPPIDEFPAEVNLTIQYTEEDMFTLDEPIARWSWLDSATNSFQHVEKQEIDPARNVLGATITKTGRYIVYEDP